MNWYESHFGSILLIEYGKSNITFYLERIYMAYCKAVEPEILVKINISMSFMDHFQDEQKEFLLAQNTF